MCATVRCGSSIALSVHIRYVQKALNQMSGQLIQVLTNITGVTGLAIIRAIVAGGRDPVQLARFREPQCANPTENIAKALTDHDQPEPVLALTQALALYDAYTNQVRAMPQSKGSFRR